MKFLLWAALVFVAVKWLLRSKKPPMQTDLHQDRRVRGTRRDRAELMVPCAHCGVYIPQSEAVLSASGAVFCDEEHRRRHLRS